MAEATPSESSRKVLISGVSKGLGRALALELADRGHTIIGCSRDQTKLDSLQAELSKTSLNNHFLFKVDVRCNKNVQEFAQIVAKNKLVPDILGIIVNMSSGAGRSAHEDFAPYCSSKWAVEGLSKCIGKGLPKGMAIVALNPGSINTDMLVLCCGDLAAQYLSPQKWAIKAATMILNLTSKDNGESLTVNNPSELSAA
ncbi:NADPH-dependent pterin aldehyde reductase-like isoform X2 [Benincasa hispida]|uniref:NADPH-dependent pterin aldehyde reductase-like isoform X2 n=1 Tax=Benincasa hispida TaxID=102211 RepID=UPI001901F690|nr:NADPH-dependent pterin aldehyde reductase-like isoform X2 [Benincasa hispida]